MRRLYICFLLFICFLITLSCTGTKARRKVNAIPYELIGVWSSEDGCIITFSKDDNSLILSNFSDSNSKKFSHVPLSCVKNGIMAQFASQVKGIKFSGTFVEGEVIIDNNCKKPLHKVDN